MFSLLNNKGQRAVRKKILRININIFSCQSLSYFFFFLLLVKHKQHACYINKMGITLSPVCFFCFFLVIMQTLVCICNAGIALGVDIFPASYHLLWRRSAVVFWSVTQCISCKALLRLNLAQRLNRRVEFNSETSVLPTFSR